MNPRSSRVGPVRRSARASRTTPDQPTAANEAPPRGRLRRRATRTRPCNALSLSLAVFAVVVGFVATTSQQAAAAPTPDSTEWYAWSSNNDRGTNLQLVTCAANIDRFAWSASREVTFEVTFGCKGADSLIDNAKVVTHLHTEYKTLDGRIIQDDVKSKEVGRLVDFDRYRQNGWTYIKMTHTDGFRTCRNSRDYRLWAEMAYRISLYDARNGDRHVIETPANKDQRPISQALAARTNFRGWCLKP